MSNNNSWQVQAPNTNPYLLKDMYKDRNMIPIGENTLVQTLQDAWGKGREALQDSFKTDYIDNADLARITQAKAQGMTTNQYLQNQASNRGWLMDYIANPLSSTDIQKAANTLNESEKTAYQNSLQQRFKNDYVYDNKGSTTDVIADLQRAVSTRPYAEQTTLKDAVIADVTKGTLNRLLDPNGPTLRELNAQRVKNGLQPITSADIFSNPQRVIQALREMDKSNSTYKLLDTAKGQETINSFITDPQKAANANPTTDRFANAVQYNSDTDYITSNFNETFPNRDDLDPASYEGWKTTQASSMGLDPNDPKTKATFATTDALVKQWVNDKYTELLSAYSQELNSGKTDAITLDKKAKAKQALYNFVTRWGGGNSSMLTRDNQQTFTALQAMDDLDRQRQQNLNLETRLSEANKMGGGLVNPVDSKSMGNITADPNASKLFYAVKQELIQAVNNDPELKNAGITDGMYSTVAYNFVNQALTPGTRLHDQALTFGVDTSNIGKDELTAWNNAFNAKTFAGLAAIGLNPVAAIKAMLLESTQSQNSKKKR